MLHVTKSLASLKSGGSSWAAKKKLTPIITLDLYLDNYKCFNYDDNTKTSIFSVIKCACNNHCKIRQQLQYCNHYSCDTLNSQCRKD